MLHWIVNGLGIPVSNGYVFLRFGSYQSTPVFFDEQGNFSILAYDLTGNAETAELVAWDLDNFISVNGPNIPVNGEETVLNNPIVISGVTAEPEGLIFVGGDDGNFYCIDAENGSEVWAFGAGDRAAGSLCLQGHAPPS